MFQNEISQLLNGKNLFHFPLCFIPPIYFSKNLNNFILLLFRDILQCLAHSLSSNSKESNIKKLPSRKRRKENDLEVICQQLALWTRHLCRFINFMSKLGVCHVRNIFTWTDRVKIFSPWSKFSYKIIET